MPLADPPNNCFDQFSALAVAYHFCKPALLALEEVMEDFSELMQRLLEIQSGGRQRSHS
jgi:hypothetical protein